MPQWKMATSHAVNAGERSSAHESRTSNEAHGNGRDTCWANTTTSSTPGIEASSSAWPSTALEMASAGATMPATMATLIVAPPP